jgi:hypothetical protein
MRIIRLKLNKPTEVLLVPIAKQFKIADTTFVSDLFALYRLKGNGLPTQERLDSLVAFYAKQKKRNPSIVKSLLSKRKATLGMVSKTGLFQKFVNDGVDPIEAVERILAVFGKLHRKTRQIQCITCPLLTSCDYGKQYDGKVTNIITVVDPDYKKKVNSSCPHLPSIEGFNEFSAGVEQANSMSEAEKVNALATNSANPGHPHPQMGQKTTEVTPKEVEKVAEAEAEAQQFEGEEDDQEEVIDDPEQDTDFAAIAQTGTIPGSENRPDGDPFNGCFSGNLNQIIDDAFVDKLSGADLLMFQIAQTLDSMLGTHKKGHFNPTAEFTSDKKDTRLKGVAEEHKMLPAQHGLPDEIRNAKLEKGALLKNQHLTPQKKKTALYLLIDCSSSMEELSQVMNGVFATKAALAATFGLAVVRKVAREGGMVFARFFNTSPGKLHTLRAPADYAVFEAYLSRCTFSGGGTHIPAAISAAAKDIQSASGELAKAEILMITDAQDHVDVDTTRAQIKTIPLNILDVTPGRSGGYGYSSARGSLEVVADNYYKLNGKSVNLEKMVELVGGKKKLPTP